MPDILKPLYEAVALADQRMEKMARDTQSQISDMRKDHAAIFESILSRLNQYEQHSSRITALEKQMAKLSTGTAAGAGSSSDPPPSSLPQSARGRVPAISSRGRTAGIERSQSRPASTSRRSSEPPRDTSTASARPKIKPTRVWASGFGGHVLLRKFDAVEEQIRATLQTGMSFTCI